MIQSLEFINETFKIFAEIRLPHRKAEVGLETAVFCNYSGTHANKLRGLLVGRLLQFYAFDLFAEARDVVCC